ncbi:Nucleotide-binding universal stress protein, UspA family [Syntrophus gentianae]|uniref:Nucleotide-binding universal stress protein, UspA family n=1 Tax=Syntrophus gentianae TaxID=43775 RepID=A0A1H7UXH0_9BACT|nr:universal stress protein [Syntrophus gentianae]SEM01640.1 Nucleotide-binding universal stress protein, UspA family [Syntrophus gentianae]
MYKKILAAVNEHLNSEVTARYALNLAQELRAKFYICFVAEEGMPPRDRHAAEEAIQRLFGEALERNIQAESIAATGNAVREIEKIVRREKIGMVFASTRREDLEKRFYAGTVARSLSLKLPCSVALVRVVHFGRIRPKRILVPVKARINHVRERAAFVTSMAKSFGAKVYVFHSPKPMEQIFSGEIHLTPPEWEERMSKDIEQFMKYLKQQDIEHEGKHLPGRIARNITIEAFAKRHDLVIMGASERSLLASLLKGNPVEQVLRETPCDLIILKPRHED